MPAIVVNSATPFGSMSNAAISKLIEAIRDIHRIAQAASMAQTGVTPGGTAVETGSNFGVAASSTPGAQGAAYIFALTTLDNSLQAFLTTNQGAITALDNG